MDDKKTNNSLAGVTDLVSGSATSAGDNLFKFAVVSSVDSDIVEVRDMETDDGISLKISEIPLLIAILKSSHQTSL